ncbi:tripartite tricarboxylate transporter substrate binding protein [Neisseriaceae bacterium CLB008]|nr:tripartite tricarboxylate transporter substrate binding protein [Neisseriaceae bacterium]
MKRVISIMALVGLGLLAGCQPSSDESASAFPSRSVTLVVPFPPGGGTDALARQLAPKLSESWGQAVVVKNLAGASGQIAEQQVLSAPHDGYTILFNNSSQVMSPAVLAPEQAAKPSPLVALGQVALSSSVLIVPQNSPFHSVADVLQAAQQQTVFYASCGIGTPQHWMGMALEAQDAAGLKHVPYKGCAPALIDVVSAQVAVGMVTESSALPMIQAGKVRALGVTAAEPSPWLPEVPVQSQWLASEVSLDQWYGFFVPADVAEETQKALSQALLASVGDEAMQERLRPLGFTVSVMAADAFQQLVQQQTQYFNQEAQKQRSAGRV